MQKVTGSSPVSSTKLTPEGIRAKRARKSSKRWEKMDKASKRFAKVRAKIRENLTQKQKGLCYYCREPLMETCWGDGDHDPTLDHVVPKSDGGGNSTENLVVACRKCNADKGSLSSDEYNFVKAMRRHYWPSRLDMPDMHEALLGHLEVRGGRLWSSNPKPLPRVWKTPEKPDEPQQAESKIRSLLRHLAERLVGRHRQEDHVGPRSGDPGNPEVERPQEEKGDVGQRVLVPDHEDRAKGALITRPNAPVLPRLKKVI